MVTGERDLSGRRRSHDALWVWRWGMRTIGRGRDRPAHVTTQLVLVWFWPMCTVNHEVTEPLKVLTSLRQKSQRGDLHQDFCDLTVDG